jgi:hypothetical protein
LKKQEEKMLYKIVGQKQGITITCETSDDVTYEEARNIAVKEVLGGLTKALSFNPFVLLPITTKERWEDKTINFCPRCGENLHEYDLEQSDRFDCHSCDTSMEVHIHSFGD